MDDERSEEFKKLAEGAFSPAENAMGQEMYQANVEHMVVMNHDVEAHILATEAAMNLVKLQAAAIVIGVVVGVVGFVPPAVVLVWKYVFRW